ncbi:hypothetical protein ACOME3_002373 [Neoechinorhynchus agilis]
MTGNGIRDNIVSVILDFYKNPDRERQNRYERALVSDEAWQLCPQLLLNELYEDRQENITIQFFGASVLYSRISRMYAMISKEDRIQTRLLLMQLVGQLGSGTRNGEPRNVFTRICIAFVQLALNMMNDYSWPEPLVDICEVYKNHSADLGLEFVDNLQLERLLLKLFSIFSQELTTMKDVEKKDSLTRKIGKSSVLVISTIEKMLTRTPNVDRSNRKSILDCLASWCALDIDLELFTPTIFNFTFDSLVLRDSEDDTDDLNEAACEALIAIMCSTTGMRYIKIWTGVMYYLIMCTKKFFIQTLKAYMEGGRNDDSLMDYLCRIVRVLVALVENHVACFLQPKDPNVLHVSLVHMVQISN